MSDDAPQPDRIEGAPHPRETAQLIGQGAAEAAFLAAYNDDRLHHAWLLTGARGVGKATFAWRAARFLLAHDEGEDGMFGAPPAPDTLDISPDHPVSRRILARSEPQLFHITRQINEDTKRLRDVIRAEDVRSLHNFLMLSSADGGRRAVIIDAADEMNVTAANSLLKMLEEPPARTTFFLISHQPSGLLPTIRSRCRELRLPPLTADDMAAALAQAGAETGAQTAALAALSGGSVGEAVRLINLGGLELYAQLVTLLSDLPNVDRPRALALANAAAQRGAEDKLTLLIWMIELILGRMAQTGATGAAPSPEAAPGEAEMLTRAAPDLAAARAWADCAQDVGTRMRHGRAVNLDPASLVLDTVFRIQKTAAGQPA
ncbi:DNA polymerase III, delta prime subunit [Roseovarius nanhaiticus]|uniref:DNA polymerase III, delta prime subunit n=1 Tax=Roseovarius nanhaiticus TaxID=573024 RepID=A0A1N7G4B8_9RHOB|nr:DNA polymerase III subunit delta' [Roseovarius nanhaiticus]SEK37899.1 DNA polymerase III, delta prime subunit [Roseovarius nanhaiticus]SIS07296.1 DNA polymerase III, delta prime subunit [Roseovarius nanhaiticus]